MSHARDQVLDELRANPFLARAKAARRLSGLSTADVYLVTENDKDWLVRKVAKEPSGSARLKKQWEKQIAYEKLSTQITHAAPMRTPRVLDHGERDGRFFFDMEHVRGPDAASHLRQASFDDVRAFCTKLCLHLEHAHSEKPLLQTASAGVFDALYARLVDVERRGSGLPAKTVASLFLALDDIRSLGAIPATLCHGDLTLENLVVGDAGEVWCVDLLDAPFEHWWFDVAKLHQDLAGGWYLRRMSGAGISLGVVEYVAARLRETAARLSPAYARAHDVMVATTFARIIPYARDDAEREFVRARVEHFASSRAFEVKR